MSGIADINAIVDKMVQGVAVSSVIHVVFNKGSLGSIMGRQNLMNGAKIGGASHLYEVVLREPVKSVLNRVGI